MELILYIKTTLHKHMSTYHSKLQESDNQNNYLFLYINKIQQVK